MRKSMLVTSCEGRFESSDNLKDQNPVHSSLRTSHETPGDEMRLLKLNSQQPSKPKNVLYVHSIQSSLCYTTSDDVTDDTKEDDLANRGSSPSVENYASEDKQKLIISDDFRDNVKEEDSINSGSNLTVENYGTEGQKEQKLINNNDFKNDLKEEESISRLTSLSGVKNVAIQTMKEQELINSEDCKNDVKKKELIIAGPDLFMVNNVPPMQTVECQGLSNDEPLTFSSWAQARQHIRLIRFVLRGVSKLAYRHYPSWVSIFHLLVLPAVLVNGSQVLYADSGESEANIILETNYNCNNNSYVITNHSVALYCCCPHNYYQVQWLDQLSAPLCSHKKGTPNVIPSEIQDHNAIAEVSNATDSKQVCLKLTFLNFLPERDGVPFTCYWRRYEERKLIEGSNTFDDFATNDHMVVQQDIASKPSVSGKDCSLNLTLQHQLERCFGQAVFNCPEGTGLTLNPIELNSSRSANGNKSVLLEGLHNHKKCSLHLKLFNHNTPAVNLSKHLYTCEDVTEATYRSDNEKVPLAHIIAVVLTVLLIIFLAIACGLIVNQFYRKKRSERYHVLQAPNVQEQALSQV